MSSSRPERPPLSGMELDRAGTLRTDSAWVQRRFHDPAARAVFAGSEGVLVANGPEPGLIRGPLDSASDSQPGAEEPILLGIEAGVPLWAVDLDRLTPAARSRISQAASVVGLRDAGALLSRPEGGLAAYAMALLSWHRRHRFCANCGAATVVAEAGYVRHCPNCGSSHFPRTDPVVIMLVEHAGRLLLGRHAGWAPGQYSVLAGFVSPGESLEEAVVREVREESGIEAHDPRYVASQPWPFPSSLMIGFEARSDGGDPVAGDGELEDVRWFELPVVLAALSGGGGAQGLRLPPSVSISRFLIERWAASKQTG